MRFLLSRSSPKKGSVRGGSRFSIRRLSVRLPVVLIALLFLPITLSAEEAGSEQPEHYQMVQESDGDLGGMLGAVETMVFDLYLSDSLEGLILLEYTDDWFEILEPEDLLDQIGDLEYRHEVLPLLEGRIYSERSIDGVGTILVDLFTFRVVLELAPRFLPSRDLVTSGRLPEPNSKFSLKQAVGVAASGRLDDSNYNSALNHRTLVSSGRYFGNWDGTFVRDQDYVITRGSLGGFVGDYEVGAGLLQTAGQSFASSAEFLGLHFETSEDLLLDRELLRGSRLEVFIPSRARVEFYRGTRLLAVQVLDFGLQEVDTRNFPQGSYDVDVIIREDNGRVTREQLFFTKTGNLTLRDTPYFSIQAGVLRSQLDVVSKPVFQGDLRLRVADAVEIRNSLAGTDSFVIGSLEGLAFYRGYLTSLEAALSSEGNSGVSGSFSGEFMDLFINLRHSQTLSTGTSGALTTEERRALSQQEILERRLNSISRKRASSSGSISRRFGAVNVRLVGNRNERADQDITLIEEEEDLFETVLSTTRYAYGPRAEWRIFSDNRGTLRLDGSYLRSNSGYTALINLSYRIRAGSNTAYNSRMRVARSDRDGNEAALLNSITFDNVARGGRGIRASLSNEVIGSEERDQDVQSVTQLDFDRRGDYLRTNLFVRDSRFGQEDTTSGGLNAETAFLVSERGTIDIASPPQTDAVLIADLRSETTRSTFDILVDGQTYDRVPAGSRAVIGVHPFRTYTVGIRPAESADIVNYDVRSHKLTFFPGNIIRQSWQIERVFIALGNLVDPFGEPIPFQRIQGTPDYAFTEEDGSFQIEISGAEQLSVQSLRYQCSIELDLPDFEIEYFHDFGEVICHPLSDR